MKWQLIRKTVHYLLLVVVIFYLISGFGITEFRVVESLTFGLITKPVAFEIHDNLWIPFIVILVLHISLTILRHKARFNNASLKDRGK